MKSQETFDGVLLNKSLQRERDRAKLGYPVCGCLSAAKLFLSILLNALSQTCEFFPVFLSILRKMLPPALSCLI
jgi:hypothetical protein